MITLYIAWQDGRSRQWFPVGRLVCDDLKSHEYEFTYINGAYQAKHLAGFVEIPGFPDLAERYQSPELFPIFRNRTMNLGRPDRQDYLTGLGLDETEWNAIAELAVSGGQSYTDNFEVFPSIEPDQNGKFVTRFMLHGVRHVNEDAIRKLESLQNGEELRLAFELNNPVTSHAILVTSNDYYVLGWLPRYLVDGMHQDNAWMVSNVTLVVARINHDAPLSNRILVDFTGCLPVGFSPMRDLEQFLPIP